MLVGAAAAGAALGLGSLALAYFSTHPIRRRLSRTPGEHDLLFEDVSFQSRDGLRMSGWFIPSPNAVACVILCHGFPNNRAEMLAWAEMLHPLGVHLLLFDFRAMGESDGDLCSIGYHEVADLLGAVDYLSGRADTGHLPCGVFGLSMGGAVALMAAAEDDRIRAVATHGAYARLDRAIAQRGRLILGPLGPAISGPAILWGRRWFPEQPHRVSPLAAIHRIAPRPVLLFHGGRDRIVSPDDPLALYHAAESPKILHTMPRSWHVRIHDAERASYEETLAGFFREYLLCRS